MPGRLLAGYFVVFAVSVGLAAAAFALGADEHAQPDVAGIYRITVNAYYSIWHQYFPFDNVRISIGH